MYKNVNYIKNIGLCCGCGSCQVACPNDSLRIIFNSKKGLYEPKVSANCISCGKCLSVCPGISTDIDSVYIKNHEDIICEKYNKYFGYYDSLNAVSSLKKLQKSTSGGAVSEILSYLFKNEIVDGALVTVFDERDPLKVKSIIIENENDIKLSQGSKYCPVSINEDLEQKINKSKCTKIAYVGLPCQIQGLEVLKKTNHVLNRIKITIGLFCSRTPSLNATKLLLKKNRIKIKNIEKINYRDGNHPSSFIVKFKNGDIKKIPHLSWYYWGNVFMNFFYPKRCFLCCDKTAQLADFSCGDNWNYSNLSKSGVSTVIARSKKATYILKDMVNENYLKVYSELSENDLVVDQDLLNKRDLYWRYKLHSYFGLKINTPKHLFTEERNFFKAFYLFISNSILFNKYIFSFFKEFYIFFFYMINILKLLRKKNYQYLCKLINLITVFLPTSNKLISIKKNKIAIIGGYGWLDIGDEAMPRADLINLRSAIKDLDIVMLSTFPENTKKYHNEYSIYDLEKMNWLRGSFKIRLRNFTRFILLIIGSVFQRCNIRLKLYPNIRNVLDELTTSKVLFNVGGGNLNSIMTDELSKKGAIYIASKILGLKIILSGQTIGPFSTKIDRIFASKILNIVDVITLRDKMTSINRLKEINVNKPYLKSTADDAISLPKLSEYEVKKIILDIDNKSWNDIKSDFTIGINMKASLSVFSDSNGQNLNVSNKKLSEIINYLIDKFNCKVILIPTDFSYGVDDRECHDIIYSKIIKKERVIKIDNELDDISLKSIISLCDFVVGARYHFCVFAASSLVPFLGTANGVYQKTKLKGLASLSNLPECYIDEDLNEVNLDNLISKVVWLIDNLDYCRCVLEKRVPEMIHDSKITINMAKNFM